MDNIIFLVQGSAKLPYIVKFIRVDNNITAMCNCPAGINGMYCKHRFRILSGSIEGIVSDNIMDVSKVSSWLIGSNIERAINDLEEAEDQLNDAQKKVSACKKKLAREMFG